MNVPSLAALATVLFSQNIAANGVEPVSAAMLYQSVVNHEYHSHENIYSESPYTQRESPARFEEPEPQRLEITEDYQETARERLKRKGNELLGRMGLERNLVEFKPKYDHPDISESFRHWRRWDPVINEGQKRYWSIEITYTGDDIVDAISNAFRAETYSRDK